MGARHWFSGRYDHTVDAKGRVSLPAPFRKVCDLLSDGAPIELLAFPMDGCIFLIPKPNMLPIAERFRQLSFANKEAREATRRFFGHHQPLGCDGQGRILVNEGARKKVGIEGEVVFIGALDRMELWSKAAYERHEAEGGPTFEELEQRAFDGLEILPQTGPEAGS
ncbi:MAG: division/cell wall cluster transcriptional repressor MraZ [Planctomycetes bacterium]|nr:division/cell wall cluster transcriptional repressor MraZ [Planctomycetota bacterium]